MLSPLFQLNTLLKSFAYPKTYSHGSWPVTKTRQGPKKTTSRGPFQYPRLLTYVATHRQLLSPKLFAILHAGQHDVAVQSPPVCELHDATIPFPTTIFHDAAIPTVSTQSSQLHANAHGAIPIPRTVRRTDESKLYNVDSRSHESSRNQPLGRISPRANDAKFLVSIYVLSSVSVSTQRHGYPSLL